jgi:signal transduction histidine kinase
VEGEVRGRCDGRRLQQVLRNLVSNACAYGARDEPIRVTLGRGSDGVRFAVSNRGKAIEPAVAEQLFNPLQRGDLDRSGSYKEGLGLGLYIVREIVQAHGGEVHLRSDAEETVFSVHLPPQV